MFMEDVDDDLSLPEGTVIGPLVPTVSDFWDEILNLPVIAGRNHSPEVEQYELSVNERKKRVLTFIPPDWLDVWQLGAVDGEDRRWFVHVATAHYTKDEARRIYELMTNALVRWPAGLFGEGTIGLGTQVQDGLCTRISNAAALHIFPSKPFYVSHPVFIIRPQLFVRLTTFDPSDYKFKHDPRYCTRIPIAPGPVPDPPENAVFSMNHAARLHLPTIASDGTRTWNPVLNSGQETTERRESVSLLHFRDRGFIDNLPGYRLDEFERVEKWALLLAAFTPTKGPLLTPAVIKRMRIEFA